MYVVLRRLRKNVLGLDKIIVVESIDILLLYLFEVISLDFLSDFIYLFLLFSEVRVFDCLETGEKSEGRFQRSEFVLQIRRVFLHLFVDWSLDVFPGLSPFIREVTFLLEFLDDLVEGLLQTLLFQEIRFFVV